MHQRKKLFIALVLPLMAGCGAPQAAKDAQNAIQESFRSADEITLTCSVGSTIFKTIKIADKRSLSELANAFQIRSARFENGDRIACNIDVTVKFPGGKGFVIVGSAQNDSPIEFYPDLHLDPHLRSGFLFGKIDGVFFQKLEQSLGGPTFEQIFNEEHERYKQLEKNQQ